MLWLTLSCSAQADTLLMANGDRYSGKVSEQDDKLVIVLDYGGTLTLPRHAVSQWQHAVGQRQAAVAAATPPVASSVAVSPALAQASPVVTHWQMDGHGDVDVRLKRNDKQTNNLYFKGGLELANPDWRYSLDGEYTYETSDDVTKTQKYKLEPAIDYFFTPQAFWRNTLSYDYNMLSPIDLQLDMLSGPGYRFWNQDKGRDRLEMVLQGGVSRLGWTNEAISLFLVYQDDHANYPVGRVQWDYRQPPFARELELYSEGMYQKHLHQPSPYVTVNQSIDGAVGLRYYINQYLRLGISENLEWDDAWMNFPSGKMSIDDKEWRQKLSLGAQF